MDGEVTRSLPECNKIANNSGDHKYFIITPQLVHMLTRDPYEFTLWAVIKMVAGDKGVCTLETPDLAVLAMQSTGKCHQSRAFLLTSALLDGRLYKEPGYPRAVWHLTIPDLWPQNTRWRVTYNALRDRIQWKRDQRHHKKIIHLVNGGSLDSSDELSPSPGELSPSPGERKKNLLEPLRTKEEPWVQVWLHCLAEMRAATSQIIYDQWLRNLHLLELNLDQELLTARVECPNRYVQEWCQARLDILIRRTLAAIVQIDAKKLTIVYTVKGD